MISSHIISSPEIFRIGHNPHLEATIPASIGNLTNLVELDISGFIGTIPTEIGALENLELLDLGGNEGTLPLELSRLQHLDALSMSDLNKNITVGQTEAATALCARFSNIGVCPASGVVCDCCRGDCRR